MPAVAITDHGNMFGAIEFYRRRRRPASSRSSGAKSTWRPAHDRPERLIGQRDAAYHFTLLARDFEGYSNLVKLVSAGASGRDSITSRGSTKRSWRSTAAGLIGMSACLKGEINVAIQDDDLKKAERAAQEFADIFGPEYFYLELHDHGIEAQHLCNERFCRSPKRWQIPVGRGERCAFSGSLAS